MKTTHYQAGVVSLFVVIFTTLVLTVLTVSFLRIMIQEQKQATNQDLAQSAYDSAVSGVEDAKRVLRACAQGKADACTAITSTASDRCETVQNAGVVTDNAGSTETIINSGSGDTQSMNQGYTCVLITRQSDDYLGNLDDNASELIPLQATGVFNTVTIEWMRKGDNYKGGDVDKIEAPTSSGSLVSLPSKADGEWSPNAPALLRVQAALPPGATVSADALDSSVVTTSYLRPSTVLDDNNLTLAPTVVALPTVRAATSAAGGAAVYPRPIICSNSVYTGGGYACKASLRLPAGSSVPASSRVAFLRITSLYKATAYRITLSNDATPVQFDGVQPTVDSTGRAGTLYRRVSSRINMSDFLMPSASIDITGNLCKDFYVTDSAASGSTCSTKPQP